MPDPNKIEGGRWDRVLRSVFNLKGAGSTSARIAEDISPTFNFPYRDEHDFLIGDKLMWCRMNSVGTVITRPRCIITNASENKLIVMEGLTVVVAAGANPYIGCSSGVQPFVAAVDVFQRDGRWGPLETGVGFGTARCQEAPLAIAPLPVIQSFSLTSPAPGEIFPLNIVLQPLDSFFCARDDLNTLLICTFYWREHLMEPSEVA